MFLAQARRRHLVTTNGAQYGILCILLVHGVQLVNRLSTNSQWLLTYSLLYPASRHDFLLVEILTCPNMMNLSFFFFFASLLASACVADCHHHANPYKGLNVTYKKVVITEKLIQSGLRR